MSTRFEFLTSKLRLRPRASDKAIKNLQETYGVQFPEDYISFLKSSNGSDGFVGDAYLILMSVEEIPKLNEGYAIDEFAPGLILFGTSGGGVAYLFDIRSSTIEIVEVPFDILSLDTIKHVGFTLLDLLEYKYAQYRD